MAENNMVVPQKLKNRTDIWSSKFVPVKSWGVQGSQIPGAESRVGGWNGGRVWLRGTELQLNPPWVSANPTHTCLQGYIFIANSMLMLHFTKRLRATIVFLFLSKGLIQVIPEKSNHFHLFLRLFLSLDVSPFRHGLSLGWCRRRTCLVDGELSWGDIWPPSWLSDSWRFQPKDPCQVFLTPCSDQPISLTDSWVVLIWRYCHISVTILVRSCL